MRVLDLFSGIGGFSLGLERAGMRTVAFCESAAYPRRILAKHWPKVPIYDDVRTLSADALSRDGVAADLICGGFPCQDISLAGKRAGLAGERSGLWSEFARLIRELRPRWVVVENVTGLLSLGLDVVLGDLAACGYDATWECIPASAVGAPHRRDRVWIVAYAAGDGRQQGEQTAPSVGHRRLPAAAHSAARDVANPDKLARHQGRTRNSKKIAGREYGERWAVEPDVGRLAHGVPHRVDRLTALGNSVVPQIPEMIGRAIMAAEAAARSSHG